MTAVIDQIIAFLAELRGASTITQATSLLGAVTLLLAVVGWPFVTMWRKERASVTAFETIESQRDVARQTARKLEAEIAKLHGDMPEAFVARHRKEMADGNEEVAMSLAEGFLDMHR
ncbi:MAG: hypothetical protein WBA67_12660, partial [Jannaschia sp.]